MLNVEEDLALPSKVTPSRPSNRNSHSHEGEGLSDRWDQSKVEESNNQVHQEELCCQSQSKFPHSENSTPYLADLESIRQRLANPLIPVHLIHLPSILIDHYFEHICVIVSAFDSKMNPFRTTIAHLWQGWSPIYYVIQSMAATFLGNDFPGMASAAWALQQRALFELRLNSQDATQEPAEEDRILLTIFLLGLTTSWHKAKTWDLNIRRLQEDFSARDS